MCPLLPGCARRVLQGGEACGSLQEGSPQAGDAPSGGQLTSSVLNIIDSLYGGQAAAARQSWQQQLSTKDQPLRDMPVQPVPPPAPADAVQGAAQEAEQAASDDTDAETEEAAQGSDENAEAGRPEGPGCSAAVSAGIAASELPSSPGSTVHADGQPADQQHSQLDCAAAEPDATEDSSADRDLLAGMEEVLAERSKLQQELSGYLTQLGAREDGEGQPLVDMVQDYGVLVERLLREGRAQQYRALQGWDGPHRWVKRASVGFKPSWGRSFWQQALPVSLWSPHERWTSSVLAAFGNVTGRCRV